MYSHSGFLGALAAIFLLLPTTPILAQSNSLFENVLQGTINNTIQNEINKPQRSVTNANVATSTRESNQQVQQALNHFGYPVGSADGILGKRSRTGIAKYQKSKGYDATGTLTNAQRPELIASWRQSVSGITLGAAAALGTIGTNQTTHQDGGIVTRERRKGAVIRPTDSAVSSGNIAVTDPSATMLRTLVNPTDSNQKAIRTRRTTSTTSVIATDPATNAGRRRQTSRTTTPATLLPATGATTTTANQPALTRNRVLSD
ncbi:MAG: peptidoglycan-binding domain-containing protein [Amylibacter sp.]